MESPLGMHLNSNQAAIKIVLIYLTIGLAWIVLSDLVIESIFSKSRSKSNRSNY